MKTLIPQIAENELQGVTLAELRNLIDRCDQTYYCGGVREHVIPDNIYDAAKRELKRRVPTDLRLSRVGAPVSPEGMLEEVRHFHPMGSLENANNVAEALEWMAGIRGKYPSVQFHISYKMDGASLALHYTNGWLSRAITRGDGFHGEDVTANAARMKNVPLQVDNPDGTPFNGSVRGECILPLANWKIVDPEGLSNPRNLGNGMMRRKSGEDAEYLEFFAFRVFDDKGKPLWTKTETALSHRMQAMGFVVAPFYGPGEDDMDCGTRVQSVHDAMVVGITVADSVIPPARDGLPFEIDGLVLKVDDLNVQMTMGEVSNRPRGQIALKFPPAGAITTLRKVEVNLGRTGALIPVGIFDPIRLGGVTVSRATLSNYEEIARLGIAVGDKIRVTRRADVIPKIESKVENGAERFEIVVPRKCPFTGGEVGKIENSDGTKSAHLYSLGAHDSAPVKLGRLRKWIRELDIQGLGDVYLEALYAHPWRETPDDEPKPMVGSPADLYRLRKRNVQFLRTPDGANMIIGPLSMKTIIENVEAKRKMDLTVFLAGLGVHGLGQSQVKKARAKMPGEFDTLNDWLSGKLVLNAEKLGMPTTAAKFDAGLRKLRDVIDDLRTEVVLEEKPTESAEGKMVFVLTGDFAQPKDYYHDIITAHGHMWAPRFTKQTTHVVTSNPVTKTKKADEARKKGIPVIGTEQLMVLLTENRIENAKD